MCSHTQYTCSTHTVHLLLITATDNSYIIFLHSEQLQFNSQLRSCKPGKFLHININIMVNQFQREVLNAVFSNVLIYQLMHRYTNGFKTVSVAFTWPHARSTLANKHKYFQEQQDRFKHFFTSMYQLQSTKLASALYSMTISGSTLIYRTACMQQLNTQL